MSLTQTSLNIWINTIYKPTLPTFKKSILNEIQKDRNEDLVSKDLIRDAIKQFR